MSGGAIERSVREPTPMPRLSPRQAECLRLVYQRMTTKDIAAATGLAPGTIDTYVAEAVAALGARNRRHAAELLHAFEPPGRLEPDFSGVPAAPAEMPAEVLPQRRVGWADLMPLRRQGHVGNDLHPFLRVFWIVQLAAGLAVAFGMLAVGADVVGHFWRGR